MRRGPGSRGQAMTLIVVAVFVGFLVAAVRFFRLGDLAFTTKLAESLFWGLGTVVAGLILGGLATVTLRPSSDASGVPRRRREGPSRAVTPEELSAIESEVPEQERPEFGGVHGKPPEEMAEMIRKMAGGDGV